MRGRKNKWKKALIKSPSLLAVYVFRACFQNDNNHSSIGLARFIHRGWDSFFGLLLLFLFTGSFSPVHSLCHSVPFAHAWYDVFTCVRIAGVSSKRDWQTYHVNWMCFVERPRNWRLMTWKAGSFIYLCFEEKVEALERKNTRQTKWKQLFNTKQNGYENKYTYSYSMNSIQCFKNKIFNNKNRVNSAQTHWNHCNFLSPSNVFGMLLFVLFCCCFSQLCCCCICHVFLP